MSYNNDEYFDEVEEALRKKYLDEDVSSEDLTDEELLCKPLSERKKLSASKRKKLEEKRKKRLRKIKRRRRIKIILSVFSVLILAILFLLYTKPGNALILRLASKYVKNTMQTDDTVKFTPPETVPEGWIYDENVVNILLVGIERNGGAANTDSMILVSQNLETGKITMVSLLRDTYVDIYGLDVKRKLNYAYSHGDGMQTLIDTVENTYHIFINAYASVDYDSFESIVDMLGGVSIELTEREAEYLNSTNYISDKSNRNVKAGINLLNGNQALGYCRIRKIPTLEGVNDDYGRTLRQRKVLTSIFEEYKNESLTSMVSITNEILKSVTSNLSSDNIYIMLKALLENESKSIEQVMLPAEGLFKPVTLDVVGAVLSIEGYEQQNIDYLHELLYGRLAE